MHILKILKNFFFFFFVLEIWFQLFALLKTKKS